jgi:2-oxoglutarate dehydrogenase E2 component (dihydrolipoamide succinyltransferase)
VSIEIKVPQLPESVADATLISWHKKAGDSVARDENLVDLETDKVVLEVPAPSDGVLKEIRVNDGSTVSSGQVLALLEPGETEQQPAKQEAAKQETKQETKQEAAKPEAPQEPAAAEERDQGPDDADEQAGESQGPQRMGPAARKLVEEHDIDPAAISGSGREGRITKSDVLGFLAGQGASTAGLDSESPAPARARAAAAPGRAEHRVTMTRLRARIAQRLVEAQQTAAMLTTFNEVDMSAVIALRKRHQAEFEKRHEIKLGFMSFFVKAAIEALRRFPLLNASIDGDEIVYHEYFDIGIAVSTERGLIVPVLRSAETMGYAQIEQAIADFAARARNNELTMDDLSGGTFTITNGGIFGSLMSTPILNPPQSGILGMHRIQERPVAIDGAVVVRPMMYLAMSYDHRLVDGREAVQFLVAIKEQIEDPARLMLQV